MRSSIFNVCTTFAQTLLSQSCLLCGAHAADGQLCADCRDTLPYHRGPACPRCAHPTLDGMVCGACLNHPPPFDATLAGYSFSFPIDAVLHSYKYAGNLALLELLAMPLSERALEQPRPDLLIPMPLHPRRLARRGFNQAAEIVRHLAARLDVPTALQACRRIRDTAPQATLKLDERPANLRGAFVCDIPLHGKHVALIDDVMTSGATLGELAKAVRKQGAAQVSAWVVARTLPHD